MNGRFAVRNHRRLLPRMRNVAEHRVGAEAPPAEAAPAGGPDGEAPIRGPIAFAIPVGTEGFWEGVGRTLRQATMKCFCFGEEVALWERQREFDRELARERVATLHAYAERTVTQTVVETLHQFNEDSVHHVPRFVGHVVDALRIKLGMGATDKTVPGNVALVRAEAARMMRDWNVRHRDAAAHLLLIERAFFNENVHERPTTWRVDCKKRSRFIGWLVGRSDGGPKFDY